MNFGAIDISHIWVKRSFIALASFGLFACVTSSTPPPLEPEPKPDIIIPEPEPEPEPEPVPLAEPVADADGVIRQKALFSELPGWESADQRPAFSAFLGSCKQFARQKKSNPVWDEPCKEARALQKSEPGVSAIIARHFFEQHFTPYSMTLPDTEQGLLTAYYEPELEVMKSPTPEFSEPILPRPTDLVTVSLKRMDKNLPNKKLMGRVEDGQLQPYYTRGQIRKQSGTALAWGRPADVFFLQIQGSGRIRFASGKTERAAFSGHNGQRYHSIGRELISRGELKKGKASKAAIENWMQTAGNKAAQDLMNTNPRYVFFQTLELKNPAIGPKGSQNVALTAKASLAIDPAFHAYGSPIWIDSRLPASEKDWKGNPVQFLAIAQDTGGAIKGPLRGDLFYGSGDQAGKMAGIQKHQAKWWSFMPNEMARKRETGA